MLGWENIFRSPCSELSLITSLIQAGSLLINMPMRMVISMTLYNVSWCGRFRNILKFNLHNNSVLDAIIVAPFSEEETDDLRGELNYPSHRVSNDGSGRQTSLCLTLDSMLS